MTMPNFLVIGIGKAGTTSLYHYLAAHPEIAMSSVKEPNFFEWGEPEQPPPATMPFNSPVVHLNDYQQLFAGMEQFKRRGEASTMNFEARACHRIQHYLPDGKFICSLRHPVERAYSAFMMWQAAGVEPEKEFRTAYAATEKRLQSSNRDRLPAYGREDAAWLVRRLEDWLQRFPRQQLHIRLFEELKADAARYMHDVYEFLEVDSSFRPDVLRVHNRSTQIRSLGLHRLLITAMPPRQHARRSPLLAAYARILRRLMRLNTAPAPPLDPELRRAFSLPQREDILHLQALIDRDLTHWLPD